jgi:peptidoglycan-associated lipoprotein
MTSIHRLALLAATATTLLLGACSSTPMANSTSTTTDTTTTQTVTKTEQPVTNGIVISDPVGRTSEHLDPKSPLSHKRSIYFDFDQYSVKPEYTPVLEMHGKYLAANAGISIRVEGNTDELGGTEYNLALGQKRAEAVVRALKIYGARDAQLEAVSFGKEKPQATGHDEASHAQNRRGDLAYPKK